MSDGNDKATNADLRKRLLDCKRELETGIGLYSAALENGDAHMDRMAKAATLLEQAAAAIPPSPRAAMPEEVREALERIDRLKPRSYLDLSGTMPINIHSYDLLRAFVRELTGE